MTDTIKRDEAELPLDFWKEYQRVAKTKEDVFKFINDVYENNNKLINQEADSKKVKDVNDDNLYNSYHIAWRGLKSDKYALHSSLYRSIVDINKKMPNEKHLQQIEIKLYSIIKEWNLHIKDNIRLSALDIFTYLQHYGFPTRMIDITFNPLIALYFAVMKDKKDNINDSDARVIAFLGNKTINIYKQKWLERFDIPWLVENDKKDTNNNKLNGIDNASKNNNSGTEDDKNKEFNVWRREYYIYKPEIFDKRVALQNSGFLVGGVPSSASRKLYKTPSNVEEKWWNIESIRRSTSIATIPNKYSITPKTKKNIVYTMVIKHQLKDEIRLYLDRLYGYNNRCLFPDIPGFVYYQKEINNIFSRENDTYIKTISFVE